MPVIDFRALQPVIDNTGLSAGLSAVNGYLGLPTSSDGLNPNSQAPSFTNSIYDKPPMPGLPKPLKVDFKGKAEALYGEDVIQNFLNKLRMNSDANEAFQKLVTQYRQASFNTPGGINPEMPKIMDKYEADVIRLGKELLDAPNDIQKYNSSNGLYAKLNQMANDIRPRPPPAAEPTAAYPPAVAPPAVASKSWYQFWGGRKTALSRSRSRSRSGKKPRARKMKQRSRKRAVRRR